ncbi:uncharacterized protein ACIGJ3_009224 [Trichechus inunguis]
MAASKGTRPFTYRWNRDAPFPGRCRFSRTRGDGKRARTEAPSGSAAGEPLPGAAADRRLIRQRWRRGQPGGCKYVSKHGLFSATLCPSHSSGRFCRAEKKKGKKAPNIPKTSSLHFPASGEHQVRRMATSEAWLKALLHQDHVEHSFRIKASPNLLIL